MRSSLCGTREGTKARGEENKLRSGNPTHPQLLDQSMYLTVLLTFLEDFGATRGDALWYRDMADMVIRMVM
jgi:hypothetical protein